MIPVAHDAISVSREGGNLLLNSTVLYYYNILFQQLYIVNNLLIYVDKTFCCFLLN